MSLVNRYNDGSFDGSPSPSPQPDDDLPWGVKPPSKGAKARRAADDPSRKSGRQVSRPRRFDDVELGVGVDVTQDAYDAAVDEHELLNSSHIWSDPVQAYAQELRLREQAVEQSFHAQLAEQSLDRALGITEWAGRSLDALADIDHQSMPATVGTSASASAAPVASELSAAEEERRIRKREAAMEGWRKRRDASALEAEAKQAARERRAEAKRQKAIADAGKPKKPPAGYAFEPLGPDGLPATGVPDFDANSSFTDSGMNSPAATRGDGPSRRKRPRTERASAAAAAANMAATHAMLEGLDPNDPMAQALMLQHEQQEAAARNGGLIVPGSHGDGDEDYPDSPSLSPAPSAVGIDDDDEFRESVSKKSKSKALKPVKGIAINDDDLERKIWRQIATTYIPKAKRMLDQGVGSRLSYHKRLSGIVQREAKRFQVKTKAQKDVQIRAKRVMREMLTFWRGNDKRDKERKTKAEKEALDKVKKEEELREAKRAARKLNFLITQTELYSHFVGSKLKTTDAEESEETSAPSQVVGAAPGPSTGVAPMSKQADQVNGDVRPVDFDDEDEANLIEQARRNAQAAAERTRKKAQDFDTAAAEAFAAAGGKPDSGGAMVPINESTFDGDEMNFQNPTSFEGEEAVKQPNMLTCQLKEYQLKGLSWLAGLYNQGINGILADEMGLGKTVQSIALMAHLAETHNIWGPFLVIAPASTLHNWQQEISRFVPTLKALPYWGNVKDRAVLRKFWNRKAIRYDKDAPFHILVTSYQLVVADEKYFQRVKWQYMVLDEAQAIKSSSSARWKTLLGFHCRNRLLLTGTPIQNSMQELWALLHFIMPSLFDSHDEFSEWFSKDIEGGAEKGAMNEHQLRRLHMILKPFMLRRIKKNVQNELGDKIEIDVMCDLTPRQKFMYNTLRTNISISDLVRRAQSLSSDDSAVKRLMNLIMQFRKVCNHPELFERADVVAPLSLCNFAESGPMSREADLLELPYSTASKLRVDLPRVLYRDLQVGKDNTDTHHLQRMMSIWRPSWVESPTTQKDGFGFAHLLDLNASDLDTLVNAEPLERLRIALREQRHTMIDENADVDQHRSPYLMTSKTSSLPVDLVNVEASFRQGSRLKGTDMRIYLPSAVAPPPELVCNDRTFAYEQQRLRYDPDFVHAVFGLPLGLRDDEEVVDRLNAKIPDFPPQGILGSLAVEQLPQAPMLVPQLQKLILDSGKLARLDKLLHELRQGDHRVLVYFQMTRMIDLMEEYLAFRGYKYLRLDGTSTISERRDMVMDWQTKPDIFIFLLSTRAGGLGINLTAADTVIFYDSDWNPSNDAQAMDRAHRLGQTKQVTVYRLITQGTIDERILKMARNKKSVQDAVVGSSNAAAPAEAVPKQNEVVSLLLDDAELEESVRQSQLRRERFEAKQVEDGKRGAAQREANKKAAAAAALEQSANMATAVNGFGMNDDDDDGFGWFAASATAGNAGDAEDELGVAKASEAPVVTGADGQPVKPKKKRAPKRPKEPVALDENGEPPAKKPRKRGPTKKQREAAAAAAALAAQTNGSGVGEASSSSAMLVDPVPPSGM